MGSRPEARSFGTAMARPPDLERRQELLDAVVEEFAVHGIGDRSLRDIAAAVGTSHRMLLHHFGSRNELLLAIVEEVERRQMALLRELPAEPAEAIAAMWADLRRPELRPFECLFFECYARGLAIARGLLLDLVATGDTDGVDAAAQAFIDLIRQAGV
jgi:AcrR family transcriptional regulator